MAAAVICLPALITMDAFSEEIIWQEVIINEGEIHL